MSTPDLISRQYQRELQAHQEGVQRLREATSRAEAQVYASSSVYGNKLVGQGLNLVTDAIEAKRSKIAAGSTGEFAAHVKLLEGVPSSTLALITLKVTVDTVFAPGKAMPFIHAGRGDSALYADVVRAIGQRVFDECLLRQFAEAEPEVFNNTRLHKSKGYGYRVAKYRARMRRISHEALKWPQGHKVKVGAWLLDRLSGATGWFSSKLVTTSHNRAVNVLIASPEVIKAVDAIMVAAEALSACSWPMLCPPNDWTTDLNAPAGGYLTSELRGGMTLVRRLTPERLEGAFLEAPHHQAETPVVAGDLTGCLEAPKGRGETATPSIDGDETGKKTSIAGLLALLSPSPQPSGNDAEHVSVTPSPGVYDLQVPVRFINTLQKVPYQVNQAVLGVALQLQEAQVSVGSFRQSSPLPLPHKPEPWDEATDEQQLVYKRGRVLVEEENSLLAQRNYQTSQIVSIAQMYRDEESFYFPWFFDFRGRIYPQSNHLTPQGTDFSRSLLLSAYSGPADREWLGFQVATTWGLGKDTMADRQAWVDSNLQLIEAIALDPIGTLSTWQGADEPWQFLAACFEFHDCFIARTRDWSNLLVGWDATCSGLQHLSALTRDRGAAELVNVAPSHKPADAYAVVAEATKKHMPPETHHFLTRKLVKRVVMTIPYNLTKKSARDYLRQSLPKDHGLDLRDLTHAVYDLAVPEVLPGPMRAKRWIQTAVDTVAHETGRPVAFTSPSGFPVILDKRIWPVEQVDTRLLGRRMRVTVADFDAKTAPTNPRKITIGAMPNFVHSLDAALLHRAFADWDRPIATIHDCIGCLSCDVEYTRDHVRDCFADLYHEDPLQEFSRQLGYPIDPDVVVGTLDIEDIRSSNYLFC